MIGFERGKREKKRERERVSDFKDGEQCTESHDVFQVYKLAMKKQRKHTEDSVRFAESRTEESRLQPLVLIQ